MAIPGSAIMTAMDVSGIYDAGERADIFDKVKAMSRGIVAAVAAQRSHKNEG